MVQGKFIVHDSTISLTDETGGDACLGAGRNPGTYHWASVDGSLWFHIVQDPAPTGFVAWPTKLGGPTKACPWQPNHRLHPTGAVP